jgi:hypothetical protein
MRNHTLRDRLSQDLIAFAICRVEQTKREFVHRTKVLRGLELSC